MTCSGGGSTADAGPCAGAGAGAGAGAEAAAPAAAARRSRTKFDNPALTAAAMPSSNAATPPTCQPDGPTAASLPSPRGPPEKLASTPMSAPVIAPLAIPHSGAASRRSVGAILISSQPPTPPAMYGRASTSGASQAGIAAWTPGGSAASSGTAGSWPRAEPVGATIVPAPNANPGPTANDMAQMTAFGT